jgi:hypothetical protein
MADAVFELAVEDQSSIQCDEQQNQYERASQRNSPAWEGQGDVRPQPGAQTIDG